MGDIEFQHLIEFTGSDELGDDEDAPVRAGARAVLAEATIVTDITMSKAGITGRGHNCEKCKAIGNGAELAEETGMTRTAASVLELDKQGVYDGAIATVGNAPTAAFALADCIEDGTRPAAIVVDPVGFVKAEESRQRIREVSEEYDVPAITNVGRRGGSGLAAALTNELIHVAKRRPDRRNRPRARRRNAGRGRREIDERRVSTTSIRDRIRRRSPPRSGRTDIDEETDNPVYAVGVGPGNP